MGVGVPYDAQVIPVQQVTHSRYIEVQRQRSLNCQIYEAELPLPNAFDLSLDRMDWIVHHPNLHACRLSLCILGGW